MKQMTKNEAINIAMQCIKTEISNIMTKDEKQFPLSAYIELLGLDFQAIQILEGLKDDTEPNEE